MEQKCSAEYVKAASNNCFKLSRAELQMAILGQLYGKIRDDKLGREREH